MSDAQGYDRLIQEIIALLGAPDSADDFLADLLDVLQGHVPDLNQANISVYLRQLHQVYIQLDRAQTLEELYIGLVSLGASRLGYDRLSLLLLNAGRFDSCYALARDGALDAQISDFEPAIDLQQRLDTLLAGPDEARLWLDVDLYEGRQLVGQGWQLIALLTDGGQPIAALVADNLYNQRPPRAFETDLLILYCGATGNMIARRRAEIQWREARQTADQFQYYLKSLHEISIALAMLDYGPEMYRRVIELGKERLGFDRMGLFVFNPQTQALEGSYGTDVEGNVRYEGDRRPNLATQQAFLDLVSQSQDRVLMEEDVTLTDKGEPVGQGWHATAALWNGAEVMGYMVADNLTRHRSLRPYERELFSLYSSAIGHLISYKRNERALRASETRFDALLEIAPVAVVVVTQAGRLALANKHALGMFGYSRAEVGSLSLEDLLPESFQMMHVAMREQFFASPHEQPVYMATHMEPNGRRRDGTLFPVQVALSAFEADGEHMVLAAIVDLTGEKEAQQQRNILELEQERVDILTDFIKHAAHEFRTPLSIIKSSTYLLERVVEDSRRQTLYERIRSESDQVVNLVEGLSTLARLDRSVDPEIRRCNLNSILHAIVDSMNGSIEEKMLKLTLDLDESPVMIDGSVEDLNLALMCLLENAIRYTSPAGLIELRLRASGDLAVLDLRDSGIGMSDEVLANIFERFYRADDAHSTRGFGLGLPIAQKVVEIYGGTLTVKSAPDQGSTFTITLPLHRS